MLDGDTTLVLATQDWVILAEQLVLIAGVLVEVLILSAYHQTQNI